MERNRMHLQVGPFPTSIGSDAIFVKGKKCWSQQKYVQKTELSVEIKKFVISDDMTALSVQADAINLWCRRFYFILFSFFFPLFKIYKKSVENRTRTKINYEILHIKRILFGGSLSDLAIVPHSFLMTAPFLLFSSS